MQAIGADQIWAGSAGGTSISGSGVTVDVIDSGYRQSPDYSTMATSVSFTADGSAIDTYGHGSHVTGITNCKATYSGPRTAYPEKYRGVADMSKWIGLRVLDATGMGRTSDVIAALDWTIQKKATYNIRVINLPLGQPVFESYKTDPLCQMVERCVAQVMVVVVAAGNYGKDDSIKPVHRGITSPGNNSVAIAVGAVNTHDTPFRSGDTVAT